MVALVRSTPSVIAFLLTITFVTVASAANLAFVQPDFNSVSGSGLPYFTEGQDVTISWTTVFDATSLSVFQTNDNGGYDAFDLLAASYPQSTTFYVWKVVSLRTDGTLGGQYHFFLQNSANASCTGCFLNSPEFTVEASSATSSSATTSTTSSPPKSSPTSSPTPAAPSSMSTRKATSAHAASTPASSMGSSSASAAAAGATNSPASSKKHQMGLGIPLGVGLGAGIPVIFAIVAIFFMFFLQRRRKQRQQKQAVDEAAFQKHSRDTSGTSSWSRDAQMMQENRDSRESGALGHWGHPRASWGHPGWSHQFRPSMAPTTEENEDDDNDRARRSWIQPFEFELPGSQDHNEMSHARQGLAEALSEGSRSQYSRSELSFGENGGAPAVPQPVHSPHHDDEWPLPTSR